MLFGRKSRKISLDDVRKVKLPTVTPYVSFDKFSFAGKALSRKTAARFDYFVVKFIKRAKESRLESQFTYLALGSSLITKHVFPKKKKKISNRPSMLPLTSPN